MMDGVKQMAVGSCLWPRSDRLLGSDRWPDLVDS